MLTQLAGRDDLLEEGAAGSLTVTIHVLVLVLFLHLKNMSLLVSGTFFKAIV